MEVPEGRCECCQFPKINSELAFLIFLRYQPLRLKIVRGTVGMKSWAGFLESMSI